MASRVQGTGTYTPTRHFGSGTFTSTTAAEYTEALANLQGDPVNYTVKTTKAQTRTITFDFNTPLTATPNPLTEYQRVLTQLQGLVGVSAYLISGTNELTRTITYTFDTNRGPL